LHEARRVHKGAVWPVGTPMSRSSRSS
jgi:hypothetical protein